MYHVTLRGNHQQDIFFSAADRQRLSALFAETLERFNARLHAYCYMTNHVHALIQVGDAPLGRIVLRVASRYARVTQARLETTGHLFERRYHAVLVDVDQYFVALLRYIHLNPVVAGIVSSPDAYPWSSHHAYSGSLVEGWLTTDFGLSLFGNEMQRARGAYCRFINDAIGAVASPFEELNPSDRRILGSDEFAKRLLGDDWKPRSRKSLDDLVAEACTNFNVETVELESSSRSAKLVAARAWLVNVAVAGRVASISAVARRLNRDESSLRHALRSKPLKA